MPLVFAGIAPHSPILLDSIGKEKTQDVDITKKALEQLEKKLYVSNPDILLIISDHNKLYDKAHTVLSNNKFHSSLEKFGDLQTQQDWLGYPPFASQIAVCFRKEGIPIQISSKPELSYGSTIPLLFLTNHKKNIPIIPFGPAELDSKELFNTGSLIKELLEEENLRVAVIVAGNGAHTLSEGSPAGFHADGEIFDQAIINNLETKNSIGILNIDNATSTNAKQSILHPLSFLLGILKNVQYTFETLSYEHPFGVGYLVGNFKL
jgi:MEMO1 family protein